MFKNFAYYVLFFFMLNIIVSMLSNGASNFTISLIYLILLGIWALIVIGNRFFKRKKTDKD